MAGNLREIWNRRELVAALVVRDLKIRYRNSILGFMWSLLTPLLLMLVLWLVFKRVVRFTSEPNYTVKLLCGLVPWLFFQQSLLDACPSVLKFRQVVKKVYFPREVLPISVVLANLVHLLLSVVVLFGLLVVVGTPFHLTFLFLPVLILVEWILVQGMAFLLASLHTFYQDVQYIVAALLMMMFYLSPIIYKVYEHGRVPARAGVPAEYEPYYMLNPLAVITEGFRQVLLRNELPNPHFLAIAFLIGVFCMVLGYKTFRACQWRFPEVL
ncbi:MAG: ABC transporter permease [Armatimonadota bacterium]